MMARCSGRSRLNKQVMIWGSTLSARINGLNMGGTKSRNSLLNRRVKGGGVLFQRAKRPLQSSALPQKVFLRATSALRGRYDGPSSPTHKVTSRRQCSRFSMRQCARSKASSREAAARLGKRLLIPYIVWQRTCSRCSTPGQPLVQLGTGNQFTLFQPPMSLVAGLCSPPVAAIGRWLGFRRGANPLPAWADWPWQSADTLHHSR